MSNPNEQQLLAKVIKNVMAVVGGGESTSESKAAAAEFSALAEFIISENEAGLHVDLLALVSGPAKSNS